MPVNWPDVIGRKYSDIKKELDALKGKEQEESSPKRKGLELLLPERKLGLDSLFKGVYKTNRLGNPFRDLGISDKVTPSNAFQWKSPVGELTPKIEGQPTIERREEPPTAAESMMWPFGRTSWGRKAGEALVSPKGTQIRETLGAIGMIGAIAMGVWQVGTTIQSLTAFRRLPQYKAMLEYAKSNNIPRNSPVMKNAEAALKTAFNMRKAGANEAADEIMSRFYASYSKAMPTATQPAGVPPRLSANLPTIVPRATQTGAMAFGGKRFEGKMPEVPPIIPKVTPEVTIPKELNLLVDEAKKYNTFEEFEKAVFSEGWKREQQFKTGLMGDVATMGFPKATEIATRGEYIVSGREGLRAFWETSQGKVAIPKEVTPPVTEGVEWIPTGNRFTSRIKAEHSSQLFLPKTYNLEGLSQNYEKRIVRTSDTKAWTYEVRKIETAKVAPRPLGEEGITMVGKGKEVMPTQPSPEAPQAITRAGVEVVSAKEQAAQLAEQVKAKLAAQPVVEKPPSPQPVVSPIERRAEIQKLLAEPAKNLPKGTTKIALRKELAGINKSLIPQEKKLRQQIMATVKAKSLGATQYRGIFKTTGGSRYLTNLELTQLEKVLKAVQKARPKKIGGKTVVTQATEKAIQSLKTELIKQGKYTQESFDNTKKYLRLKTDRFESPTKFISEVQAKELIRRMNYEAEIGLIENDSLIAKALKNRPDVQSAIDKAKGRMTASSVKNINGKPVNVAATYDMRYYTGFLQERTGGRFYDIWAKANKIRLENKQEALKVFSKVEKVPGYKKVAADNDALDRIRRHIAAKNKWAEVESPELSKTELAVANALEDVYKMFPNMVREFRFKVSYDRHNGNVDLISSEIPDAPKADLREAINIYESQGRDALKTYLDTKTWGVIESGYEPRLVVNPKLRLNKIKDYVVGKGRLHAREGLEFPTNKENILKDTRVYINQMLNLKLEPYMKELDRIYSENASKLKNPQKAARNLELALLEMQGKTIDRTPLTDILMKVSGYGYSAIFLRPSLAFRNLFQNLAFHPDRESFLNPMNRKLTDEELAYWETYIRQNRAFKSDILLQEEIGAGRVAEFVKRISYYGYSDDVNRLGSFWASLNKAEGALLRYKKDGDVGKFIGSSGLQDLTNLQQKEGLELLVTDETEAIRYIAREVTNNTHFLYDRAQRAPLEMGSTGRILASLLTFTRSWAQRLYIQLNTGLKSGSKVSGASRARAWKNVIGIIVVGLIAGEIYKKITGKEKNPYDPRNILSWTPGGLPIGLAGDIALALTHLAQALTGDKEAQSRLTTEIPALGDDFIPFYSQIIGIAESLSDTQFIDRKFLRDIRAKFDKDYQPNESYYKKERGIIQKIQHALFGSEPEVAEPKKGGGLPNPFKKEVTPGGGSSRPGNPFR